MNGYFLKGSRGEYLMVVRGDDTEAFIEIIGRLGKMRSRSLKALADDLMKSLENVKDD
jgi:hypothetical protein